MKYTGGCHCKKIEFEVEGVLESVMECNCSHCSKKGYLLWFLPKTQFSMNSSAESLNEYTFNKHAIKHKFCASCGVAPFAFGENKGVETVAINARCLDELDLSVVKINQVDGKSL